MAKKVTMQDIAGALGITKVSVSKAINNQPGISDDLRRQILLTAKEMGYAPLRPARDKTLRFAFVCPKRFFLEDDAYYTTIYYYISKRCTALGHAIISFVVNYTDELHCVLPEQLRTERFDGLFIAGEFRPAFLKQLMRLPGAQVAVDFYRPDLALDCVISDNYYLGQQVCAYLMARGHREIGFIGDIHSTSSICDRYFGYVKALRLAGLPVREAWHIVNNDAMTGQYTLQFDLPDPLPTAFVCHCDKAAFTLMQRLDKAGVPMPQVVSVISFDNTNLCELILPHLTSVDFDRRQIAHVSMEAMLSRLEDPQKPAQTHHIQGKLIVRDSVADIAPDSESPCQQA